MPVITPKRKEINAENIHEFQGINWPKYRHVVFSKKLQDVALEVIRPVVESMVEHVERVKIETGENGSALWMFILTCICSPSSKRLKKLEIYGSDWVIGAHLGSNQVFYTLLSAPSLEDLTLNGFQFASWEAAEDYFATTKTLRTLTLSRCGVMCGTVGTDEVASDDIRQGLRRNQTLTKISIDDMEDGPSFRAFLLGIAENRHIKELVIGDRSITWRGYSNAGILPAFRRLLSDTTSIQKIHIRPLFCTAAFVEIFLGLASNQTIQEIDIHYVNMKSGDDKRLENAIRECFAKNKTLCSCKLTGRLAPQSRATLSDALSQSESLKRFRAVGGTISQDNFQFVARVHSASLQQLLFPDWASLISSSVENAQAGCHLRVLDLSRNSVKEDDLETILPSLLNCISKLSLAHCEIYFESVPALCDFIRSSRQLKKLNLGFNPISTQGAASILEAVSTSMSLEHLDMCGPGHTDDGVGGDERPALININECHDSLRTLLLATGPQLVFLDLTQYKSLGLDAIRSVAAGLRGNMTVKTIKLPWLDLAFIHVLGEALTVNHSLKSLEVNSYAANRMEDDRLVLKELTTVEEEAVMSFLEMLPRMRSLVYIKHLFDFKASTRFNQALVEALKENMVLKEIQKNSDMEEDDAYHVCNNEKVQFFLELNRLGRHHYLAASENKPLVSAEVLPHLFSRMADPEYSSHLYYFLHRTSPDLVVGQHQKSSSSATRGGLKRRLVTSAQHDRPTCI